MKKLVPFLLLIQFLFFNNLFSQNNFDEKWITHFEKTNYKGSPDYNETMKYYQQFADDYEFAEMKTFGVTPQGRDLKYIIISKDKSFTPELAKKSNKPIILLQNGIHSGEIEGKDASMLLLREILVTKEKEYLLDNVIFIIVPIFNIDGHERRSAYNRINQNGPEIMGWRTTAQNYNLNRDYMKADAPEMRAMLSLYNSWVPDIYIDSHTTDGADYQYTITYIVDRNQNIPAVTQKWVKEKFIPAIENGARREGFLVSPYVYFEGELENGIYDFVSTPRFSTGFASLHNRPEVTIETHMLKPFKDRVFSTKAVLEGILELANNKPDELIAVNKKADESVIQNYVKNKKYFPILFETSEEYEVLDFKGFKKEMVYSEVMGRTVEKYSAEKADLKIPYFNITYITDSVLVPNLYLIPQEWTEVIERLKVHGIKLDKVSEDTEYKVERYKFYDITFKETPFEGRMIPKFSYNSFTETVKVPAGTIIINPEQRQLGIIMHLLEPKSGDSFVSWGFFNQIFEQKEYFDNYSMEPIAKKMLNENPELKKEFYEKIYSDEIFKKDSDARLNFFYKHTKYYDSKYNIYPVMRVVD